MTNCENWGGYPAARKLQNWGNTVVFEPETDAQMQGYYLVAALGDDHFSALDRMTSDPHENAVNLVLPEQKWQSIFSLAVGIRTEYMKSFLDWIGKETSGEWSFRPINYTRNKSLCVGLSFTFERAAEAVAFALRWG